MADRRPTCRAVSLEVDDELVHARVRGVGEPTAGDLAILAAAARELRRLAQADPELPERQEAARQRIAARNARIHERAGGGEPP